MELEEYRRELVARVQERALDEGLFDQEAFFHVVCGMLRDSEAIADYQPASYRFGEGTNRFMTIDGYDQSAFEMDESIVVIACDDGYSSRVGDSAPSTIQSSECMKYIRAMRRFIAAAYDGSFLEQGEESSAAWEFASFIHENRKGISRFRLYFVTDREYTGRESNIKDPTDIYSKEKEHKISLEAHVWDLRRLMETSQAAAPLEHLTVDLGAKGISAVKAPDAGDGMDTYLMFLSGQTLADWYRKHGSKLMEANVRSFLSLRGKVNRGIRHTLDAEPERFVAYNNGLSATASMVDMNEQGRVTAIHDLQIVNGGQTTASIFYSQKKDKLDLSKVVVPVKLVVVREDVARELVPYISRYTNSQNKVAETDFSSNSEYQVKLSQLSQQVLTPPMPGSYPTHWYYERTRGQYDSERNRRDAADRKRFEKANPSRQRIKMIDAPKYLMCWDGYPHIASLGSQKCFARFVELESKKGKASVDALDTEFFKRLVCKRIIFDTVYKRIKTADWFRGAYQVNIAEYAVAKYALDLHKSGEEFDFDAVWRTQRVNETTLARLMKAAEQASDVLNDPERQTQNVSEWAKKEPCWDTLRRRPTCLDVADGSATATIPHARMGRSVRTMTVTLPDAPARSLISLQTVANSTSDESGEEETSVVGQTLQGKVKKTGQEEKALEMFPAVESTSTPRHKASDDVGFDDWSQAPVGFCLTLLAFAREHGFLSPKSETSLRNLVKGNVVDINVNALDHLLAISVKSGFHYEEEVQTQPRKSSPEREGPVSHRSVILSSDSTSSLGNELTGVTESVTAPSGGSDENDMDYRRDFLMAITPDTWRTILAWANSRHVPSDDVMVGVAKIERRFRLTDEQAEHLWAFRATMIRRGFPASQFAPRPGTY